MMERSMFPERPDNDSLYVFVYGTLMRDNRLHESRMKPHRPTFIGEAERHDATIGDVGFPVMMHGRGVVHGELFRFVNIEDALKSLDFVEGYFKDRPDQSLYRRELVDIECNGHTYPAWAYFGHDIWLVARAQEKMIPDGRWKDTRNW